MRRIAIGCLCALCGCVSTGFAAAETALTTFSLTLSPAGGKSENLPLLPVCVTVEIANTGSKPIEVPSLVPDVLSQDRAGAAAGIAPAPQAAADGPLYVFVIGRPDGTEVEAAYADHTAIVSSSADRQREIPPTVSLGPGESLARDFCLGYGRMVSENTTGAAVLFSAPGQYSLSLRTRLFGDERETAAVEVTLADPNEAADRNALNRLRTSPLPEAFLAPPLIDPVGNPDLRALHFPLSAEAVGVAEDLLQNHPESTYASYARLLAGVADIRSVRESTDRSGEREPDLQRRIEGFRRLRQAGDDPRLPRRYREVAYRSAGMARNLGATLEHQARKQAPSVKDIIGESADLGLPDELVFRFAWQIAEGTAPPAFEKLLRDKLTPGQLDALCQAARTKPEVAQFAGVSPAQKELADYVEWAEKRRNEIPWRDPATAGLLW